MSNYLDNRKPLVYDFSMKWEKRSEVICRRCGRSWRPYKPIKEIRQCPYCKSAYFDKEKVINDSMEKR